MRPNATTMGAVGAFGAGLLGLAAYRKIRARNTDLLGKLALVVGGSRGLGLEISRRLLAEGCHVVLVARDEQGLFAARNMLVEETDGEIDTIACDVADADAVEALATEVRETLGPIDILVNCASIIQVGPLESQDLESLHEAMDINHWGTVHTTLAFLDDLKATRGRIVNIDSIGGTIAVPHLLPYTAAKFATYGFSEGLRVELAKNGVRVTTVVPGLMRTGSPVNAIYRGDPEREYRWFAPSGSSPFSAMSARRAAKQIIAATKRGDALAVLGTKAKALRLAHGVAPSTMMRVLARMDRGLPTAGGSKRQARGWEIAGEGKEVVTTAVLQREAERHNQFAAGHAPV